MNEWKEKKLKNIAEIRISNVDKKIYPSKSIVRLCNYMDVYRNDYIDDRLSFSIGSADGNQLQRFALKQNDVIITKDSETPEDIAIPTVVIEKLNNVVCGYHLAILRPNSEEIDGTFLMQALKMPELRRYFYSIANGSTRYGLTIGNIESATIKYPHISVQRKITDIAHKIDKVIQKTQAAIAKYQAIKQGMLHDLFTRGIDIKTGKLRTTYKEAPKLYKKSELGMIPKGWEIDSFSSKMEIINGGTPSTHNKSYWNGNIPWLSVDDFNNGQRYVISTSKKITVEGLKNSSTNMLQRGMIIISARGTVGVIAQLGNQMAFNQSCYGLNSTDKDLTNDFAYYFLLYYKEKFGFNSFGSVFSTITRDYFDFIKIAYPVNIEEAAKIVRRLSSVDEKLDTENTYLQKLQQLKSGLMNDLLSGKKKVKLKV